MTEPRQLKGDAGSIAPMLIGLGAISITLCLVASSALSIFVLQRRLTTLAESMALAEQLQVPMPASGLALASKVISTPDQQTTEVRLCANWKAPWQVLLLENRLNQLVCASAAARLGK